MLKRTKDTLRAVGETLGAIAPTIPDAQTAAEQCRQDLVTAQGMIGQAELALQAAHERGAADVELQKLEAALASIRMSAERAERAYKGAEKRLAGAQAAEQTKTRDAQRAKLRAALAAREAAADQIDALAVQMAAALADLNSQDDAIREAIAAGVASRDAAFTIGRGRRCVELSLQKAGVIEAAWLGDPAQRPDARAIVGGDNSTLAAAA